MSALRFKVGDLAIVISRGRNVANTLFLPAGADVEIVAVGPWPIGDRFTLRGITGVIRRPADYIVSDLDGVLWACTDSKLRKRRPPIPPEVLEQFNVAPVDAVPA